MVRSNVRWLRGSSLAVTAALIVAACGGSNPTTPPGATAGPGATGPAVTANTGPKPGGTIYILSSSTEVDQLDPQRAYTGEDLAWLSATLLRSLTAYQLSADDVVAAGLVPDLATDLGTASADAKTWTFTLRDGVTFEDASPITCADVRYGVSRTYATDVVSGGPTYAIQYIDVPYEADGQTSVYKGPYGVAGAAPVNQDLFEKAVECSADGKTITFHLNQPVPDFNYTVTLGFSPVPKAADTGETYGTPGDPIVSSGPYKIDSYTTGNGGKLVLVRNTNWSQASDTYRHPYPDVWEMDFLGPDSPKIIDQRMLASTGLDKTAVQRTNVQPENLSLIFQDPKTPLPAYAGRAISGYDIYSLYYYINVPKVPNVKTRQAMMVALDRESIRKNSGGAFLGEYADGLIKPNIGPDYAPTGLWTDMFGEAVPDTGSPDLAKRLIAESGVPAPTVTFDYRPGPVGDKNAAIVKASLELAGFTVNLNPIASQFYTVVFSDAANEFGSVGWGADWPNAKTVIAPAFTQKGGWDLSRADDPAFNAAVDAAAAETDRTKQQKMWQDLNKQAMQNGWIIPTFFEYQQRMTGTDIGNVYLWGPYGSWAYGDMYVKS